MCRAPRASLLCASLAALLVACSSGGGSDGGSCTRSGPRPDGPGDIGKHFPAAVGDAWYYALSESENGGAPTASRTRISVTGTRGVNGFDARIFTETRGMATTSTELLAVGPSGVTVLGEEGATDPLTAQLTPYQLFYFPLTAGTSFVQLDCQGADLGMSVDPDDKNERVDVRSVVTIAGTEVVSVPAGTFQAVRLDTDLEITIHTTAMGSFPGHTTRSDWLAPEVGLVRTTSTDTAAGQTSTSTAELVSWMVDGVAHEFPETAVLAAGQPLRGDAPAGVRRGYAAAVTTGVPYGVGAVLLGGSGTLEVYGDDAALSLPTCWLPLLETQECHPVVPSSSPLYLGVSGPTATGSASYVAYAVPILTPTAPVDETASVPPRTLVRGQVGPRGTSRYTATGLVPGAAVTVALVGMSADADLRIYTDETRSTQLLCTLDHSDVGTDPESCATTSTGTVYFSVLSGELERDGAAYSLLVWQDP